MIKKIFAKLVNWSGQREDFSKSRFRADQEDQARMARERLEQIMTGRDKKYVSEAKDKNLFFALNAALQQILNQ